jgi:hypothetical protein
MSLNLELIKMLSTLLPICLFRLLGSQSANIN